nr:uncharacterized protein LOC112490692 [Ziziphus jujuba var. spinosa]
MVISSLLLQKYLNGRSEESGSLANSGFIPILLRFVGVFKFLTLLAKVSFEKSASRRSEKQLSVLFGAMAAIAGNMVCFLISPSVLDFNFGKLDGFGRSSIAVLMGCLVGFLFMPATKSAKVFWLGTDQSRSNLAMISCGWFTRLILYANYLVILFTAILWIKPLSEMLVNKNTGDGKDVHLVNKVGHLERLFGSVGIVPSNFAKFRIWSLLLLGFLQLVALRPNLQMYWNKALCLGTRGCMLAKSLIWNLAGQNFSFTIISYVT